MNNAIKILIASFLFASCGGNTESVSIPNDFNPEVIISNQNSLQKILNKEKDFSYAFVNQGDSQRKQVWMNITYQYNNCK